MMRLWAIACLSWLSVLSTVYAHPLAPAAVLMQERSPTHFTLQFRRPARGVSPLTLRLPAACTASAEKLHVQNDELIADQELRCARPLAGQTLAVRGFGNSELSAIVHIQYRDGESIRALLTAERDALQIPARSAQSEVLRSFIQLGAEHMLSGWDHLMFTAGLLLLGGMRQTLLLLTAFTLGHSVTLGLAAILGWSLPRAPVELGIALTLLGLALTVLSRIERASGVQARSWWTVAILTFAVGLLHGLGFADGLLELSLPKHALLSALFGFNLGVELAQLSWACALSVLLWLVARVVPAQQDNARRALGYAMGALAALWCIERAIVLVG